MSKGQKTAAQVLNAETSTTVENLNKEANLLQVGTNALSVDDMLEAAENVGDEYFDDATSEYLELKAGEKKTLLFTGFGTMVNDEGKTIETAEFVGAENKKYIHASAVIVGSLKKSHSLPVLVRLTHNGMVMGKNKRQYADIRVQIMKDIKTPA